MEENNIQRKRYNRAINVTLFFAIIIFLGAVAATMFLSIIFLVFLIPAGNTVLMILYQREQVTAFRIIADNQKHLEKWLRRYIREGKK